MATKKLVEAKIAGKKVVVFSKSYCPFCAKAKHVFEIYIQKGYLNVEDYEVWEIEKEAKCNDIQNVLGELTGARSVPRVFINGEFFGGGDDVVKAAQVKHGNTGAFKLQVALKGQQHQQQEQDSSAASWMQPMHYRRH